MGKDVKIDTEKIMQRISSTKEQYKFKIKMFGDENSKLEAETQVLRIKAEKLKQQIYQDDLSEFEKSGIIG